MTQKSALITGITGQDGAYLAEFLLNKGYIARHQAELLLHRENRPPLPRPTRR